MASILIHTADESVTLTAQTVKRLLDRGDGDAALSSVGVVLVLLSSLLYAVYIISVNQWTTSYSPLKFIFWIVLGGLFSIVAFSFVSGEHLQMLHGTCQWASAVQLALLPTVLSLYFMTVSINNIGSTPSAIMGALEPVTGVFIGCMVFSETFSLRLAIGIVLILSAVIIIMARSDKKSQEAAPKRHRISYVPPRLRFPFHRKHE